MEIRNADSKSVGSFDPNEKIGPAGFGEEGFVPGDESLPYAVYFENKSDASAAARRVHVVDQLDEDLDWTTFEQGRIVFGSNHVEVPPGLTHYETSVLIDGWRYDFDLEAWLQDIPLLVRITADLDLGTGLITWLIDCVDPGTGFQPEDPTAGFLPPNDDPPVTKRGEGHINYIVSPKAGLPSGTQIYNEASIVFDYNPAIVTDPAALHTLDQDPPSSSVDALPETTTKYPFLVSWSGQDEPGGSGIAQYDIYVRVDDGDYALWLSTSEISGSFNGQPGHSYVFYSVATDNVGHVEATPVTADTMTTIPVSVPGAPTLGAVTATTITLADLGAGNLGSVPHTVFEETTGKWIAEDGTLVLAPVWQPMDAWADTQIWGLTPGTEYHIRTKAILPDNSETELGETLVVITSRQGDANGDGQATGADLALIDDAMGSSPGQPTWDPRADLDGDQLITPQDSRLVRLARIDPDQDGDCDQEDFAHFQRCHTGENGGPPPAGCAYVDLDDDDDVDMDDFDLFNPCRSGASVPFALNCLP